jgi:hypothetical protein
MVAPKLPRAAGARGGPGAALSRGGTWWPRSCPESGVGARAAERHGGLEAAPSREAGAIVLTWSLYAEVPGPQGTDSGPQAHPRRGYEPAGGPTTFPRAAFLSLYVLGF